ncbi:ClpP class serine protease [Bradyrhizobium japonicum]|uniref:S49 family peptidase n=1 Tax=Bradyrhizobium japonicum TaxID=375 RepID=UPI0020A21515|nr:S49 family peptidase [Bradyrhizobium japonicum]MCP1790933.1 ClpP class serine protease [Bradyrhizobium japonicum]MCP1879993.1 ClpP class serine protease [Bradyrhizobium japonicum]MCP1934655.1 ClpP class serine protease [Bradyrhizobium japonicum]MCP1947944.1 ClpP class serine protease [Bradyrhizobium japonicum]MCS4025005.1 ClpP class serine protease [Bradyrhizobium japonicum]
MTINVRNPLIFDAALTANWAMEEGALRQVMEIAARETQITPQMLEAYRGQELERSERATRRGNVAVIDVAGPLFKRANLMTTFCGATAYETLRRDLQAAMDNASIRSILLNIHSPGGEAAGVAELATAINEVRGKKPIVSYAGDQAASAAFWLGTASDEFIIGPTAALGSMGVVAGYRDTSAQDAARGIKTIEFVSSQSPYKRVDINTQEGRDRVQARVDAMAAVFVETVAKYRGVSVEHALEHFGQGDVLIGKAAVDAGMADGVATFEQVLASLSRGESPKASYAFNPAATGQANVEEEMKDETGATAATTKPEETTTAAVTIVTTASTETVDLAAEARTVERKRVTDIMGLTLPGYEEHAAKAIETGSSAHEFSAMIVAAEKAKRTERAADIKTDTEANSGVAPSSGQERAQGDEAAVNAILGAMKLATGK